MYSYLSGVRLGAASERRNRCMADAFALCIGNLSFTLEISAPDSGSWERIDQGGTCAHQAYELHPVALIQPATHYTLLSPVLLEFNKHDYMYMSPASAAVGAIAGGLRRPVPLWLYIAIDL